MYLSSLKDMLSTSSEASKKEIQWKVKLDECKNENKMMKKYWNEVLRVIADICMFFDRYYHSC